VSDADKGRGSPSAQRQQGYRRGHTAEYAAAAFLIAKGHRILARRYKTSAGEIDLIVIRAKRIGFVEVKRRATLSECEAAITPRLQQRVRRAAELWIAKNPRFQSHDIGFDLVFVMPWRWPVHLRDGL
jgi:putative endonuclease